MDFKTLTCFVAVAEELNITRAAAKLNISQPPLSSRIRQLEEDLGTELFIRSRQGLTLTSTGAILLKRARQILELVQNTRAEVTNYQTRLSGELRIGTVEGRAPYLLARWITGFSEEFPLVTYTVRNGGSDDILDQLCRHLIDIAVIAAPFNMELLHGIPVGEQPWVALIPGSHPLAAKKGSTIPLADLDGESLIIPERSIRAEAIERWFAEQKLEPVFLCRTSNYTDAVSLVEQGLGISIFPQSTYTPNPQISVKLITDPPKKASYYLVYLKKDPLPELAEAFRDYVSDFIAEDQMHSDRFRTKEEEFDLPGGAELL